MNTVWLFQQQISLEATSLKLNQTELKIILKTNIENNLLPKATFFYGPRQSQACNQLYKPYSWDSEREVGLSLNKTQNIPLRIIALSR